VSNSNSLSGFRSTFFWSTTIIVLATIIVVDWFEWFDAALVSYLYELVIEVILGLMFLDWWRIKGSASSVYKWITVLFFCLALNDILQFAARFSYVYHSASDYKAIIDSVQWQYRSTPKLVALIYFLSFAVWQRWGRNSVIHDGKRQDMANGFTYLQARIIAGELRFRGHSHQGLVLGAEIIIKPEGDST
jgi:hypothetical protein